MSPLRVGVLVPCRNEAAVVERRLANLARLEWPAGAAHRLVVVDDGSTDATAGLALAALEPFAALEVAAEVATNEHRPGKNGAIETGLARLADSVDLVVLTDADVLVEPEALGALVQAFEGDERLGMACGAQAFVRRLDPSGACGGVEGPQVERVDEAWDRATALVRSLESRWGKLFSVHGQWLAWRADLGLAPARGVAADDVDLMLRARASRRPRVERIAGARFHEEKPPGGAAGEAQGLRRARAWFQVFEGVERPPLRGLDALQRALYANVPALLPWLALGLLVLLPLLAGFLLGALAGGALALALVALCLTPYGRQWVRTLRLIVQARRAERAGAMPEAWEMSRD